MNKEQPSVEEIAEKLACPCADDILGTIGETLEKYGSTGINGLLARTIANKIKSCISEATASQSAELEKCEADYQVQTGFLIQSRKFSEQYKSERDNLQSSLSTLQARIVELEKSLERSQIALKMACEKIADTPEPKQDEYE